MKKALAFCLFALLLLGGEAKGSLYILSSSPDGSAPIYVDDDLKISVSGSTGTTIIINDENHRPDHLGPFYFEADEGYTITIEATDYWKQTEYGKKPGEKKLSAIYLVNARTGKAVKIFSGISGKSGSDGETFVSLTYVIGTDMREYCLSSSEGGCFPVRIDDDLSVLDVSADNFTLNFVPDDDEEESELLLKLSVPDVNNIHLTLELDNYRGKAFSTPIYLVPVGYTGRELEILGHTIELEGGCKDNCTKSQFFLFDQDVSLGEGEAEFSQMYAEFDEPLEGYGFSVHAKLVEPSVNAYVFFRVPDGDNVFLTSSGLSFHGQPVTFGSDFDYTFAVKADSVYNLFEAGNYTIGIVGANGAWEIEHSFVIDTSEEDLASVNATSFNETSLGPEEVGRSFDVNSVIVQFLRASFVSSAKSFTFTSGEEENSTDIYCYAGVVNNRIAGMTNGFGYKPVSSSGYWLFFAMGFYCVDENGTAVDVSSYLDKFNFYASFYLNGADVPEEIRLKRFTGTIPYAEEQEQKIYYLYAWLPVMDINSGDISYYFTIVNEVDRSSYRTQLFRGSICGSLYEAYFPEGYDGGVKIKPELANGVGAYYKLEFEIALRPVAANLPPVGEQVYAHVLLDTDGDGEPDVFLPMRNAGVGVYKAVYPLYLTEDIASVSYVFDVRDDRGCPIAGLPTYKVYRVSVNFPTQPVLLKISGRQSLSLGDRAVFSFYAKTRDVYKDFFVDVYLGLYKEGRGVVWLVDRVPGAWLLGTTAKEEPLFKRVSFRAFGDGASMDLVFQLPSQRDIKGFLYVGRYSWVLVFRNHDTGEILSEVTYPFEISP